MQGISARTLAGHLNDGVYATVPTCKSNLKTMSLGQIDCKVNRQIMTLFSSSYRTRHRKGLSVNASWLFDNGSNKGLDASSERSESANEDILLFFFQLDLATRVQCALNMDQYDIAKQLRNKLSEVEDEIAKQHATRRGSNSKSEAQDKVISILRLRTALREAIDNEDYPLAANLRDEISKLEAESLAAAAQALAREKVEYAFRLGQKVTHRLFGYRAVICGRDPVCCESSSWMETANVEKLSRGCNQPFYQVLVDVHADPNLLVAYVAEENLIAVDQPDMVSRGVFDIIELPTLTMDGVTKSRGRPTKVKDSKTIEQNRGRLHVVDLYIVGTKFWKTMMKEGRFDHPYTSFLFYGVDAAGDFIPIKQLREKYNMPRHEVPMDHPEDEDGEKR